MDLVSLLVVTPDLTFLAAPAGVARRMTERGESHIRWACSLTTIIKRDMIYVNYIEFNIIQLVQE